MVMHHVFGKSKMVTSQNLFCFTLWDCFDFHARNATSGFKNHVVNMFYNHFVEPSRLDWHNLTAHELLKQAFQYR